VKRLLLALLLLTPSEASSVEGGVRIPPDTAVEGGTITLGEIAAFERLSGDRRAALARLSFGPSASPARARVLSGDFLREQILRTDPNVIVEVAPQVRIHTAYREVGAREVRERFEKAIRLRMPWAPEAVRLSKWNLPQAFPVAAHAHRTVIRFRPREDFLGRVNATISVTNPNEESAAKVERTASVEVEVRQPVVVAARPLRRGHVIDAESVRLEERDLRGLPRGTLTELEEVLGKRIERATGAGVPVLRSSLQLERLVRRSDRIRVEAASSGLELKMEARALENGVLGQVIRAENPTTRRRFLVEITGERRGRVALPGVGGGL
jgi:flagella basal body P-ring formation protein FlgA